jgi:hypothetical protein
VQAQECPWSHLVQERVRKTHFVTVLAQH